jgi:hypothetical protein
MFNTRNINLVFPSTHVLFSIYSAETVVRVVQCGIFNRPFYTTSVFIGTAPLKMGTVPKLPLRYFMINTFKTGVPVDFDPRRF